MAGLPEYSKIQPVGETETRGSCFSSCLCSAPARVLHHDHPSAEGVPCRSEEEGTDLLCRSHVLPALKSTRRSRPSANRTACGWWDQLWLLQVWKLCQLVRWAQQLKNKHKDCFDSQELQIHHSARPHLQTCASQKL